jgi:hypothetical protein
MDEHESNKAGAAAKCSIEGCDCIYFDANEEASSEESD